MDEMSEVASNLDLKTRYDEATCQAVDILKEANPVKIIRFGSAAWGTLNEHSDLDLCVVMERTSARQIRDVRRDLNRLLWEQYEPSDIEIQHLGETD
jgi:predicted nucleotidyltransferase